MTQELIDTFEELKKFNFIIDRGDDKKKLVIKFNNYHFYHLVGFHKMNLDNFFPKSKKATNKRYKYIKENTDKFDKVLDSQLKEKDTLRLRVINFKNILDLLKSHNVNLYNLKMRDYRSKFEGDYGLVKIYEKDLCCLLGLKESEQFDNASLCIPNSWMVSTRGNILIDNKKPQFIKYIYLVPTNLLNDEYSII